MAKKTKQAPRKRRSPQKNPPKSNKTKSFIIIAIMGALVIFGYWLGAGGLSDLKSTSGQKSKKTITKSHKKTPKKPLITVTDAPKTKHRKSAIDFLQYGNMEDAKSDEMADISWYEPGKENTPSKPKQSSNKASTEPAKTNISRGKKPKLAIIIDDVSHKHQVDTIKALPYHITPSIFPPSELSSSSNELAATISHHMVHLPMESGSAAMNRMHGMLFVKDSPAKVQARVDELRRLFPRAKFINNHTGSVFTSNYKAMKRIYSMLRKRGFVFVDSRTAGKTTVKKISTEYGDRYIVRDVFIDNVQDEAHILKQLKYAVKIAKKRGYAIAIGHPHKATMNALKHAGKILSGVQTVYIDELYR